MNAWDDHGKNGIDDAEASLSHEGGEMLVGIP
jgi:hypothetical protein